MKASNVLSDSDGTIKLVDYKYSMLLHMLYEKILPQGSNNQSYFSLAPESLLNRPMDTRSDIWGLGCLAIELITGKQPFLEETNGSVAALREIYSRKGRLMLIRNSTASCSKRIRLRSISKQVL